MRLHRAGIWPILIVFISVSILVALVDILAGSSLIWLVYLIAFGALVLLFWIVTFFRNPKRPVSPRSNVVLAPADGRVVAIEEVEEKEVLKQRCLQLSIFMSPFNVHFNKMPVSGKFVYKHYYPGKYLIASHPKSSELNERMILGFDHNGTTIGMRQVAGMMARKILCYVKEGDELEQGEEVGFIRFGSRVDLLLPLTTTVNVKLGQVVRANITELAYL